MSWHIICNLIAIICLLATIVFNLQAIWHMQLARKHLKEANKYRAKLKPETEESEEA